MSMGNALRGEISGISPVRPQRITDSPRGSSSSSVRTHLAPEADLESSNSRAPDRIVIKSGERLILLEPRHIVWAQSNGDWLRIHSELETLTCRMTMHELQSGLDRAGFVRIHRNALVNLQHVREFSLPRSGNAVAHLNNGKTLPVSRSGRSVIRNYVAEHCTHQSSGDRTA
jgi:DNA-binding LytR/AlgR family response regulator